MGSTDPIPNIADYRRRARERKDGVNAAPDPFKLVEQYDPASYYFGAVDKHGHTRQIRTAFPPNVVGAMERVVASRLHPYTSANDIVRDAVIHHLMWLAEIADDDQTKVVLKKVIAQSNLEARQADMIASARLIETVREVGRSAINSRDWKALQEIVDDATLAADEIHEPYSTQMSDILKEYRRELARNS